MGEGEAAQAQEWAVGDADAALARGLRGRAAEACAALYGRFARGLHRYAAAQLLGDTGLAEEVVVETLAEAVRDIQRFDPRRGSLAAWVFGIARRRVGLERRRQRRRKSVPPWAQVAMEAVGERGDGADVAAGAAERLEAQRQVARLRDALSEVEMEALVLSCVEELSAREMGKVMGRSVRGVHSILHRARRKARERLAEDDG